MSAPAVAVHAPRATAGSPTRDPLAARLFALTLAAGLAGVLLLSRAEIVAALRGNWADLLFWAALVITVNLLPVPGRTAHLTLDTPLLLAVGFVHGSRIGALVALIAVIDRREFTRAIGFSRAIFNRAQVAWSVLLATSVFSLIGGVDRGIARALVATLIALIVDYGANVLFVSTYLSLGKEHPFGRALAGMVVGRRYVFLATYIGFGCLALLLSEAFLLLGGWAVLLLLVPIVVARQSLDREIAVIDLSHSLRDREEFVGDLLARLADERLDERRRIAEDFHDELLQQLIHMRMLLSSSMKQPTQAHAHLSEFSAALETAVASLREVLSNLTTSPIGRGGLVAALERLVEPFRWDWETTVELHTSGSFSDCPDEIALVMFQITREAVMNALKHAQSMLITVLVEERSQEWRVSVVDDGKGFEHAAAFTSGGDHLGLTLMRDRARSIGAGLSIRSQNDCGTEVLLVVPRDELRPES